MDLFMWPLPALPTLGFLLFGYLLGSIPFGLILTRAAGLGDVRKIGSGNIGATNVLRTGNKKLAAATLLLDALKGTLAAAVGAYLLGPDAGIAAGFGAFLGHLFPVWLGFKGGKGIATYIGVLLGLAPVVVLVFAACWLIVAKVTRYSSLSALVATVVVPIVLLVAGYGRIGLLFVALSLITWLKHRANIERLIAGTESRIGQKG
ncbi:glycerol-3-phosphate acyltransferase [Rhizobium sp. Leaf384]|uniref:glycerol-3-phosphate 1-O-acyltransferase PlsY n=1 Tax=unclassified Rhizobium TaxID=2613769 RepID=UPI0007123294|nr:MULTISPECIES: glycerol-3-phosphate 1-O-acyltransferase PlsY [unclassified Rhizobium]KQS74117.1 glycerol-3-phosphate acyltransferase [Rhizobium sp. Leaf383]KQS80312.1 glycerol-3-phosphate acyltransferase [Rhizobium sp. Leaf384]